MRIFHEAPIDIFGNVQMLTDGDYALVHLLDTSSQYAELFEQARENGREVILDNSVFELGSAYDDDAFVKWVRRLQPTWYIVPDVLEDSAETIKRFNEFVSKYPELPALRIGVAQGSSDAEILECYKELEPQCDMMAFSFDYSHWMDTYVEEPTRWHALMRGRIEFLHQYIDEFNTSKKHHLLGCALPQEMRYYSDLRQQFPGFLYSVDTSNPVVHGLHGIEYEPRGLNSKLSEKLHTMIYHKADAAAISLIIHNIMEFRRFCNV